MLVFNVQSITDVITNSSSELFVVNNSNTKDELVDLLNNLYPNWSYHYYSPKTVDDLTSELLNSYVVDLCWDLYNSEFKGKMSYAEFRKDKYKHWLESVGIDPKGSIYYGKAGDIKWQEINRTGEKRIRNYLKKTGNLLFLHSIDINPDSKGIEILEKIGKRYHGNFY